MVYTVDFPPEYLEGNWKLKIPSQSTKMWGGYDFTFSSPMCKIIDIEG